MKRVSHIVVAAVCFTAFLPGNQDEITLLKPGTTVTRTLTGGQSHLYRFALEAGQFARAHVDQHTIDVVVSLVAPDGQRVYRGNINRVGNYERAELIAERPGTYEFQVSAADATAPTGRYDVSLLGIQPATERLKHRVAGTYALARALEANQSASAESTRKAIHVLEHEALSHFRAGEDVEQEARLLYRIGALYADLGDQPKALEWTSESLKVARASNDPVSISGALVSMGAVYEKFGNRWEAIKYFDQALASTRASGDRSVESVTLNALGMAYARLGEKRKALDQFVQAIEILRDFQDRRNIAIVSGNMGVTYGSLGEFQRELEWHQQALAVHRETGDRDSEAVTLNNLGAAYLQLGEYQKAVDVLRTALELNRDKRMRAGTNLNNLGRVYASLGDRNRALDYFAQAVQIFRDTKFQFGLAHTLNYIGEIQSDLGEHRKALEFHSEALTFARAVGNPDMEGFALTSLASGYARLNSRDRAREYFERALEIHRRAGHQRLLAGTLRGFGDLLREEGEYPRARETLEEALKVSLAIQARYEEAATLADLARLERDCGDFAAARERAEQALKVFDHLRGRIMSPKLRASLVASVRKVHELHLGVLAHLHYMRPDDGFDAAALLAAERGRARSLLEMISEAGGEIRRGVDESLLRRERDLQRRISDRAERQIRLLSSKHAPEEAAAAAKELDVSGTELDEVQSRIRETSPQYAALTQPEPLDLKGIQSKLLDEDTLLLEYSLGAEKSFLWAVTPSSVEMFELPARAEIESIAKRLYRLVNVRPARMRQAEDEAYFQVAMAASRMLLGPVAARIGTKRLLIVADGLLQYLPFATIPDPSSAELRPLVVNHEIVTAPSASVVAVLRQETAGRVPAPKGVAVLADPVFSGDDPRAIRSGSERGSAEFVRLRFSRGEAEEIARLSAPAETLKALDFDASRETALRPDISQYRIVHFATHSVFNNTHPELSGVVLSLVDRSGRPQDGFLRLYDIYNLRLGADLVVLSACRTALGEEIQGEGLIGLTRGFLYAGAPRVAASLWEIDDRTTAEVMKRFYHEMLGRGERPAAALRRAQIAMWKTKGWEAPYYWGAFVLQGEWR